MCTGRGDWSDDRMKSLYREVRAVVDAQNETMSDIDTKAMQTVRFDILLWGSC